MDHEEIEKPQAQKDKLNQAAKKPQQIINAKESNVSNQKDSLNWLVYQYFLRGEYNKCSDLLAKANGKDGKNESEFSIFVKALIKRFYGELEKSTELLMKCYDYNLNDSYMLKEIGKNLLLTGKFSKAIDIYDDAIQYFQNDWECYHYKGIASMNNNSYEMAQVCFEKALSINYNEFTLIQFGKLYLLNDDPMTAISKYQEALNINPDNPELQTSVGSLYLKEGMIDEGIKMFSEATKLDNFYCNALLGLGSLYQEKGEFEMALSRYKLASKSNPNSPIVWNNLGLCFFAKKKYIAAATCLKKAHYLDPFQWIVCFNLGLIYLFTDQYSSAYIYMNAASQLKPSVGIIHMYLGVILSQLGDISQAMVCYDKSLELENNYLTLFNYTISLINHEMQGNARTKFSEFVKLFNSDESETDYKEEVLNLTQKVKEELKKMKMNQ